jgi:ATP-dependent Zn protease
MQEVLLNTTSTGAADDIMRATGVVRAMLERFGFSKAFRNVHLQPASSDPGAYHEVGR